MLTFIRAGLAAALLALALVPAAAQTAKQDTQEKAFQLGRLDEAAVKLEAQIKSDAGKVGKPAAQLRKDADAAR